jgi:hypothetical protein
VGRGGFPAELRVRSTSTMADLRGEARNVDMMDVLS